MGALNLFTEEGRTRFRNARKRFMVYAALWLVASFAAGCAVYFYYVRGNLTPLQQAYFSQYAKSARRTTLRPLLPLVSKSQYLILVRVVDDPSTKKEVAYAVTDEEVTPAVGERGRARAGRDGLPVFLIRRDVPHKKLFWKLSTDADARRYEWFKELFYEGQSFTKMLAPSLAAALCVLAFGFGGTVALDRLQNRRYLRGEVLRGPRRVAPAEYARLNRRAAGLGIEVYEAR